MSDLPTFRALGIDGSTRDDESWSATCFPISVDRDHIALVTAWHVIDEARLCKIVVGEFRHSIPPYSWHLDTQDLGLSWSPHYEELVGCWSLEDEWTEPDDGEPLYVISSTVAGQTVRVGSVASSETEVELLDAEDKQWSFLGFAECDSGVSGSPAFVRREEKFLFVGLVVQEAADDDEDDSLRRRLLVLIRASYVVNFVNLVRSL